MRRYVIVRLQFEAIHHWPECPYDDVDFLRHPHRHIFHVEAKALVFHDDRDVEFIRLKRDLEEHMKVWYHGTNIGRKSCEMIAVEILNAYPGLTSVKVFEDNENGAEVVR